MVNDLETTFPGTLNNAPSSLFYALWYYLIIVLIFYPPIMGTVCFVMLCGGEAFFAGKNSSILGSIISIVNG